MANTKLLLVEDDENLAYMEKSCFEDIIGGYEVKTAVNGKEGLKVWQDFQPDVIVSDIDMPIMDGIEMVKKIREVDGKTIILFTTGLTSPKDLKAGYAAGANNYVKKPFIPEELDAHIHSLLQLKAGARSENASNQIKLGKYILDADHATLKDTQDGKQKMLTAREAKILELLAVNKNEVVRREAVLSRFWGVEDKDYFASRSLDVFIKKIRTALEDEPGVEQKTIRGVGFKLIAE
jgi:DNA-binding response OmpR family regulator